MRFVRMALFVFVLCSMPGPVLAHRLEPISTQFARPFAPGTGSLAYTYELERPPGSRLHVHEVELELGVAPRMQLSFEMPFLRETVRGQPAVAGAGHLEIGFRYLLAGRVGQSFAVSINPFVAAPTGKRSLVGDATEAGIALHLDKEFGRRLYLRGNFGWESTIGGSEEPERHFFYRSALVFPAARRWNPVLELLGETDTATGATEFTVQPELIYYVNPHWELKVGLPLQTQGPGRVVGVKAQVMWIFGKGSD